MSEFRSLSTQVVVSVDDSKDDRFSDGWEAVTDEGTSKRAARAKKSEQGDK